jgi:hypothetical protein
MAAIRLTVAIFGAILWTPCFAAPITIDFSNQPAGKIITDQYAGEGVTFSLLGMTAPAGPTIFSSSLPGNSLGITGQGLVPGLSSGGTLFDVLLTFSTPVDFISLFALDADDPEVFVLRASRLGIEVADATGTTLGSLGPPVHGPVKFASLGQIGGNLLFDQLIIDLTEGNGSGPGGPEVFADLTFNTVTSVPEPRTLALLTPALFIFVTGRPRARSAWKRRASARRAQRAAAALPPPAPVPG